MTTPETHLANPDNMSVPNVTSVESPKEIFEEGAKLMQAKRRGTMTVADRGEARSYTVPSGGGEYAIIPKEDLDHLEAENAALIRQWNELDLRNEKRHREWSEQLTAATSRAEQAELDVLLLRKQLNGVWVEYDDNPHQMATEMYDAQEAGVISTDGCNTYQPVKRLRDADVGHILEDRQSLVSQLVQAERERDEYQRLWRHAIAMRGMTP